MDKQSFWTCDCSPHMWYELTTQCRLKSQSQNTCRKKTFKTHPPLGRTYLHVHHSPFSLFLWCSRRKYVGGKLIWDVTWHCSSQKHIFNWPLKYPKGTANMAAFVLNRYAMAGRRCKHRSAPDCQCALRGVHAICVMKGKFIFEIYSIPIP